MANVIIPPEWKRPEREVSPEWAVMERRRLLRIAGYLGVGALAGAYLMRPPGSPDASELIGGDDPLGPANLSRAPFQPAPRNPAWTLDGPLTDERVAARHNNFYEFTPDKAGVWRRVGRFEPWPWQVEIKGLVSRPGVYDLADLLRGLPQEERLYRFRCVEAWAMDVPWTGVPLAALLKKLEPLSGARYVRFTSFKDREVMPGVVEQPWYPWPYFEALTLAEATNELTLLATGIFGRALPKQHGAPLRLVTPWKYGYKNIKSIARIELLEEPPGTFWSTLVAEEYDFAGNVNPAIPHPRWSQATEQLIGTGARRETLPYNGYGAQVAHLYARGAAL